MFHNVFQSGVISILSSSGWVRPGLRLDVLSRSGAACVANCVRFRRGVVAGGRRPPRRGRARRTAVVAAVPDGGRGGRRPWGRLGGGGQPASLRARGPLGPLIARPVATTRPLQTRANPFS